MDFHSKYIIYNIMIIRIVNGVTGKITERELTTEEIAQREAMQNEAQTEQQPSIEQQVAELQNQLDELKSKL